MLTFVRMPSIPNRREAIILAILTGCQKYGREIRQEYEERTGSSLPYGSLYVTLDRMTKKGFLSARDGESTHERGGNRRKYFRVTGAGSRALQQYRDHLSALTVMEPRRA